MRLQGTPDNWRKSSRSQSGNTCVEVGRVAGGAAVRDTKDRDQGHFTATGRQWASFIDAVKAGRYNG